MSDLGDLAFGVARLDDMARKQAHQLARSSTTGNVLKANFFFSISSSTSPINCSGVTLIGSWIRPWTWFFTRLTSESCSRSGML